MKSIRILIVDDEEEAVQHLSRILTRHGYEVFSTVKGTEAIELARRLQPHLVLLDRVLPDIDGADVASVLASDPATSHIRIVFLTAVSTRSDTLPGLQGRRFFVIEKPVQDEELLKTISDVLSPETPPKI